MQTNTPRGLLRVELLEDRSTPAVFTVTTAADVVDPNDGVLSLREAITAANAAAGADTINFNIGGGGARTIQPLSTLPFVTQPTVLDATTQPGYDGKPLIELDGSKAGPTGCLILTGGNSTVRGFAINRFNGAPVGPTAGIALVGAAGGNVIEDNYIGTNRAGDAIFGVSQQISYGVIVRNNGNVIRDNVLSGNSTGGVLLQNVGGDSANNLITNNFLGTDWTGMRDLGNGRYGVFFINAGNNNRIEGNVVSGNNEGGMFIDSDGNRITGNLIGVAADGRTPLGNGLGIWIAGGRNNTVGGTASGAGNVIANGTSHGVFMGTGTDGTIPTGNSVRGNSIYGNDLLGIDLSPPSPAGGVTPNDTGDADTGANNLQNFPVINSATSVLGLLVANVSLNSRPNTTYVIDFYASASADPSGHGEGQRYLGSKTVTTDANGNVTSVALTLNCALLNGEVLTATATDPSGNTSEFSKAVPIGGLLGLLAPSVQADATAAAKVETSATLPSTFVPPNPVQAHADIAAWVNAGAALAFERPDDVSAELWAEWGFDLALELD
jgi:CSLREA domain-containing protein